MTADFTVLGRGRATPSNNAIAGATYADASTAPKFAGPDVKNIAIGGLGEVDYSTLNLTVTQDRATQGKLGSAFGEMDYKAKELVPAEILQMIQTLPQAGGASAEMRAMAAAPTPGTQSPPLPI